jgi:hypothetical protein
LAASPGAGIDRDQLLTVRLRGLLMSHFHNAPDQRALSATVLRAVCLPETREVHIFNIVKRRDFMLGHNVPTKQEAEKLRDQYGGEYVVVQSLEEDQHLELPPVPVGK